MMLKTVLNKFCLFFLLISVGPTSIKGEKKMLPHNYHPLSDNPFFTIKTDISMCNYEVRLNDVPIVAQKEGFPIIARYNVNQWMRNGENELKVILSPLPDQISISKSVNCIVILRVRESEADVNTNLVITNILFSGEMSIEGVGTKNSLPEGMHNSNKMFSPDKNGDVLISAINKRIQTEDNIIILTRTIKLPISIPKWKWLESNVIEHSETTRLLLNQQYMNIWNALNEKHIDFVISQFEERNSELSKALYLPEGVLTKGLKEDLEEDLTNKILWETEAEHSILQIFGKGKLARLTDWASRPFIAFVNEENTASSQYDFIFRKSGDKWIITR